MKNKKWTIENQEEAKKLFTGKNYTEIGRILSFSAETVKYHLIENYKKDKIKRTIRYYNNLSLEEKIKNRRKYQPYLSKYMKNRYNSDKEFRRRMLNSIKKNQSKNKLYRENNNLCMVCGSKRDSKFRNCESCRRKRNNYKKMLKKTFV